MFLTFSSDIVKFREVLEMVLYLMPLMIISV